MSSQTHLPFDFDAYRKVWHSDVVESEMDEIKDLVASTPLLHETLLLKGSALAIKDVKRMNYSCLLGDVEKVCGWSKDMFLHGGVSFLMSQIPPPELLGLGEMTRLINEYVAQLDDSQTKNFRAYFDYKLTRQDGSVSRIIQESIVLKRDANRNISFFLALVTDITSLKGNDRQHLHLTNGTSSMLYEVDNKTGACRQLELLSKRELEIVRLLGQNLCSEEIARKLFISPHTVNTHRQNMLRKLTMRDTSEMTGFLKIYHFI
jgi:DNA-binding CsgD family transcriptional regulator